MRFLFRPFFTLFLSVFVLLLAAQTAEAARVALLIGNGGYAEGALTAPVNDARALRDKLQASGYTVLLRENLLRSDVAATMREFTGKLHAGDEVLFFFSGHLLQINAVNYLLPVDVKLAGTRDLAAQGIDLNKLAADLDASGARSKLLLIDACHKSPFSVKVHRGVFGLAKMTPSAGTTIAFANQPGRLASDQKAASTPFAQALLAALGSGNVAAALNKAGESVAAATHGKQRFWLASGNGKAVAPAVAPKAGDLQLEPLVDMSLVYIPAGKFLMGSPASEAERYPDEQQHAVAIGKGFWMGRYEVTFEQYELFCRATGHANPNQWGWGGGKQPAINVEWFDAAAFANWLSGQTGRHYRLPTEAEWEYAARAGTATAFSFGNDASKLDEFAWHGRAADLRAHPVGGKKPNPWGLYDMHGNVWEWTSSLFAEKYDGHELRDDTFDSTYEHRAVRGGSWYFMPKSLRSADRRSFLPKSRMPYIGFRVVLEE